MTEIPAERVRDALVALMQRERVGILHLMRHGNLARNTVEYILEARTVQPKRETLRRVARALATDPSTGVIDESIVQDAESILGDAAGYTATPADASQSLLELALYRRLQDRPKARLWVEIIDRFADRELRELRTLSLTET